MEAPSIIYDSSETRVEKFILNGTFVVRKTIKGRFAKLLCSHEVKILQRLKGIKGVQQIITQDSPVSFISEFIEGSTLLNATNIPNDYFSKLSNVLESIHNQGIADPDFAHSVDLLVDNEGNPHVIDLASAIIHTENESSLGIVTGPIFSYLKRLNSQYIIRRKARFLPNQLTDIERAIVQKGNMVSELARLWRRFGRFIKNHQ